METSDNTQRLEFKGSASGFFRIWIVNLLLSIVTLGIYSAWAKVRRRKYFYRNTVLDGHNFDYHANPVAILKGRLIAAPVLAAYVWSGYVYLPAQYILLALIVLTLPWLIVRSRIFNLRNTSYRNLRFDFARQFREAYGILGKYGGLTLITLGLGFPLLDHKRREFIVDNISFGKTSFRYSGEPGELYKIYLATLAFVVFAITVTGVVFFAAITAIIQQGESVEPDPTLITAATIVLVVVFYLFFIPAAAYAQSRLVNYTYSNTQIQDNTLSCALRARDLAWIYLSNVCAIIFSAGLLIPWATVRVARYRLERTGVAIDESLNDFIGKSVHSDAAAGEEMADMFDFDLGI